MASLREEIVKGVVGLLDGAGKPGGVRVHRYRARDISADKLPAIVVYPISDSVVREDFDGRVEHALTVRVELRVTGDPPDEKLDPLYVWVVKALLADPTLGGKAFAITEEATTWDAEQRDKVYGAAAVDFEIRYTTIGDNPEDTPGGEDG